MERRTRALVALGLALALAAAGAVAVTFVPSGPSLVATWVADPPDGAGGNHHGPAVGTVDGRSLVFAPISGEDGGDACRLVALEADTGEPVWRHQVPPENCTVHAVADPTVADRDGDGRPSVLVATTERALYDLEPRSGDVLARYDLESYGYAPPLVVDLAPAAGEELVVVDARGTVQVIDGNGSVIWRRSLGAYVWTAPVVGDLAGDGSERMALGTSDGRLLVLRDDGSTALEVAEPFGGAVTWLTSGQLDDDPAVELVAATAGGEVAALDGATGEVEWTRTFESFAAVRAVGDGDGDGEREVYVTASDGVVRALDGAAGVTEWERDVAAARVQMMPPPALGDATGDGVANLVVASNDGRVVALDAGTGALLADYDRDGTVFEEPTLADVDGDPEAEVFVIYADGTVVRLDHAT